MDLVDALTGLALAVGLLLVVLVENALRAAGLETVGAFVYPVGYGILVLTAWYIWIRPLDLRGPDPDEEVWQSDDLDESHPRSDDTE